MDDSPFSQIKTFNVSEFLCNIYYHIQQKPWKGFKYSYINFTKQLNDWGKVVLTILKYKFDDASRLQSKTSTCSIRAGCSSHLWKLIASVYSSSSFFLYIHDKNFIRENPNIILLLQRYKLCAATHLDIEYRSLIFSFIDNVKPSPDKPKGKFKTLDLIDN